MLTMNKKIYLNGVLSVNPADPTNNPSILVTADTLGIIDGYAGINSIATNIREYGYDAYLRVFSPLSHTVYDFPLTYIGCAGTDNDMINVNCLNDSIELGYTHVRFVAFIDIYMGDLILSGLLDYDANSYTNRSAILIPLTAMELTVKTE